MDSWQCKFNAPVQEGYYPLDIVNKNQEQNKTIISDLIQSIKLLKHKLAVLKTESQIKSGIEDFFYLYKELKIAKSFIQTYQKVYKDTCFEHDYTKFDKITIKHSFYDEYLEHAHKFSENKGPLYTYQKEADRICIVNTEDDSNTILNAPSTSKTLTHDNVNQNPDDIVHSFNRLNLNNKHHVYTSTPKHAAHTVQNPTPTLQRNESKEIDFQFDGSYEMFPLWWQIIEEVLNNPNHTEAYKICYLIRQTDKSLHKEIYAQSRRGLQAVKDALLARFNDPIKLTSSLYQMAQNLPVPLNPEAAVDFKNDIITIRDTASQQNLNTYTQFELFKLIHGNLPPLVKQEFSQYAFMFNISTPNLDNLVEFAERWTKYQNIHLTTKTGTTSFPKSSRSTPPYNPKPNSQNRNIPKTYSLNQNVNTKNKNFDRNFNSSPNQSYLRPNPSSNKQKGKSVVSRFCEFCNINNHWSSQCKAKTVQQKREIIKQKKLCFFCLSNKHSPENCYRPLFCSKCTGKHHPSLCMNPKQITLEKSISKPKIRLINKEEEEEEFFKYDLFDSEDDDDDFFNHHGINMIHLPPKSIQRYLPSEIFNILPEIWMPVSIQEQSFNAFVDSGSDINIISEKLAEKLKAKRIPMPFKIGTFGKPIFISHITELQITIGKITKSCKFAIYTKPKIDLLIGRSVLSEFNLVITGAQKISQEINGSRIMLENQIKSYNLREQSKSKNIESILEDFHDIFAQTKGEVGLITHSPFHIRLENEAPITLRPYRCNEKDKETINIMIKELLNQDLIEKSLSAYSFPVVLVDKRDEGTKSRLCIDYRKLNDVTITESFPIPRVIDIEDALLGATYFTTLDLSSGFYHIPVVPEDRPKTAFVTMDNHYQWKRMPFGLKNAPVHFQRTIANILQLYDTTSYCRNYIDDIIIFSKTFEEHQEQIKKIFQIIRKENIKLKLKKCQFARRSIEYLGHHISETGIRPLNSNTMAIKMFPAPKSVKDVRSFVGKVNYYQRFIPNRAKLLEPLYRLTKKGVKFEWKEEQERAFNEVKKILMTDPVLRIFNPQRETILYTDASKIGIGAILKQKCEDDLEHPVGYFSKRLLPYQINYSASELECLAIIESIEYWHFYLIGKKFTIVTDHQPLKALKKINKPSTRLFNWALRLSSYNFDIKYRPGKNNEEADCLSRNPIDEFNQFLKEQLKDIKVNFIQISEITSFQQNQDTPHGCKRINGLIYKTKSDKKKLFIPNNHAIEIIRKLHKENGHIGTKQLNEHYSSLYYTPKVHEIFKLVCQQCLTCIATHYNKKLTGTMSSLGPVNSPYDIIYIDTVGGFSEYNLKNSAVVNKQKYLHIAIDAHSRFVWIKTSKSQSASDFIDLIKQVSSVHPPKSVVTDRYSALKSKELKRFLSENQIEIVHTPVNHPSSNGMVERVNQTLVQRMRHKIFESKLGNKRLNRSWTTVAKECVREYNDTVHTITKFTPLYLLTGIDTHQLYKGTSLDNNRAKAFENTAKSLKETSERANKRRYNPLYEIGEEVYVNISSKLNRGKLDPLYEGPFTIKQQISDHIYSVTSNTGEVRDCHISQIKKAPSQVNLLNINQYVTHSTTPTYIIFLLTLLTSIHASPPMYETTSPYLWQRTNHVISTNASLIVVSLLQKNPCNLHGTLKRNSTETAINCNKLYHFYLQTIMSKCEHTKIFNLKNLNSLKTKRNVPLTLANNITNGVNILVLSQDITKEDKLMKYDQDHINEVQIKILQLEGLESYRTVQTKKEAELINGTLENMQRIINNEISNEEKKLILLKQELKLQIIFMKSFLNQFISGTFGEEFPYLFPKVIINTTTQMIYWKPLRCEWMKNSTLVLKFTIPNINKQIEIFKALPFTLFKLNYNEICIFRYIDVKFMALDKKKKLSYSITRF